MPFFDETFLRRLERLALVARRASAGQTHERAAALGGPAGEQARRRLARRP